MDDILNGLGHAAVYAAAGTALLVAAYFVLDLLTPGHLGSHLHGTTGAGADDGAIRVVIGPPSSRGTASDGRDVRLRRTKRWSLVRSQARSRR
jgi:hypothetical protein